MAVSVKLMKGCKRSHRKYQGCVWPSFALSTRTEILCNQVAPLLLRSPSFVSSGLALNWKVRNLTIRSNFVDRCSITHFHYQLEFITFDNREKRRRSTIDEIIFHSPLISHVMLRHDCCFVCNPLSDSSQFSRARYANSKCVSWRFLKLDICANDETYVRDCVNINKTCSRPQDCIYPTFLRWKMVLSI